MDDLFLHGLPLPTNGTKFDAVVVDGNLTLTATGINKYYSLNDTAVLTLPAFSACPRGSMIVAMGAGNLHTVMSATGDSGIYYNGNPSVTSIALEMNDWVMLVQNGSQWEVFASGNKNLSATDTATKLKNLSTKIGRLYAGYLDQTQTVSTDMPTFAAGFNEVNQYHEAYYRCLGHFNLNQSDLGGSGFVHIQMNVDGNWYSDGNQKLDLYFANRGSFDYWWTLENNWVSLGDSSNDFPALRAYGVPGSSGTMTDGIVWLWLYIPQSYARITWNYLECGQFTILDSTYGTPTGTVLFDSTLPSKYPPMSSRIGSSSLNSDGYRYNKSYFGQTVGAITAVKDDGTGIPKAIDISKFAFFEPNQTTKTFDYNGGLFRQKTPTHTYMSLDAAPTATVGGRMPDFFSVKVNSNNMLVLQGNYNHIINGSVSHRPLNASGITALTFTTPASNQTDQYFLTAKSASDSDIEFVLRNDGNGFCDGAWTGGGADYAEYFEWKDGNPNNEDRRGWSVVIDGNHIRQAQSGEVPFGVISANPCVVGDAGWNIWKGKYLLDDFGSYVTESAEYWEWVIEKPITETVTKRVATGETTTVNVAQDDGSDKTISVPVYETKTVDEVIAVEREKVGYFFDQVPSDVTAPSDKTISTRTRKKLNPAYDPTEEYIPRSERKEWALVGFLGKLRVLNTQVVNPKWIKLTTISDKVDLYLVAAG